MSKAAVISGGPGTGKSRLAAEYAHSRGGKGFWTDAGSTVSETLAALAPSLDLETGTRSTDEIARDVERALVKESRYTLWVIDNLTDLSLVNEILGKVGDVQVLVTTRDARKELVPTSVGFMTLASLEQEAAVSLLSSQSDYDSAYPGLPEVAKAVGCVPLALELLAARLRESNETPESLLSQLQDVVPESAMGSREEPTEAATPRADAVHGAIAGSLAALDEATRSVIAPLGYLADAPIPQPLFLAIIGTDEETLNPLVEELERQSVASEQDGDYVLHALTVAAIAATNKSGVLETAMERADKRLQQIKIDDPFALRSELVHYERLREHVVAMTATDHLPTLEFTSNLAIGYRTLGRHEEAAALNEETLAVRVRMLGPEHPDTLHSRNNLALDYQSLGRSEEAIELDEETLAVRKRVLGPEHPHTLASRNNLANGYWSIGRLEEAVEAYEETLRVSERVLGHEHPDTLMSRSNLAAGYTALKRHEEAVALDEETLAMRERVLGPDHPDTLVSRNNLAVNYAGLERTQEAVAVFEETLAARERLLGREHPDTLISRINLAAGYRALGRGAEADALEGKAKPRKTRTTTKKPRSKAKARRKSRRRKKT